MPRCSGGRSGPARRGPGRADRSGRPLRPARCAAPPVGHGHPARPAGIRLGCGSSSCSGDGVMEGWVPGSVRDGGPAAAVAVAELDELAAAVAPLRDVAARLHAMARRPVAAPLTRADPTASSRRSHICRRSFGQTGAKVGGWAEPVSASAGCSGARTPRIRVVSGTSIPAASQITRLLALIAEDQPGRLTRPASRRAARLVSSALDAHPGRSSRRSGTMEDDPTG